MNRVDASTNAERLNRPTAYLDGLRGLAAFLVYTSHHVPWFYGLPNVLDDGFGTGEQRYFGQLPFIRVLFTGGNAAVSIFFVLSGYVLAVGPLQSQRKSGHLNRHRMLISAAIRRPLRLYILPAAISLIMALAMQLPFGLAPTLEWPVAQPTLLGELRNWVSEFYKMASPFNKQGMWEHWFPYDPPAWTMSIELRGSIMVYSLVALTASIPPSRRILLLLILAMVLFGFYQWSLACFTGGMILAMNDVEGWNIKLVTRLSKLGRAITLHAMFFVAWYLLSQTAGHRDAERSSKTYGWYYLTRVIPEPYYSNEYWRFWHFPGSCMLVYAVLRLSWLQQFFMHPWLHYLGRVSFSLYLMHIPLEWTISDRIHRVFGIKRQKFTTPFDDWLYLPDFGPKGLSTGFLFLQILILPMNLWLAQLGTRYLDEPSVRIGRDIVDWIWPGQYQSNAAVRSQSDGQEVHMGEVLPR